MTVLETKKDARNRVLNAGFLLPCWICPLLNHWIHDENGTEILIP